MKLSLKVLDHHHHHHQPQQNLRDSPLLFRGKIPITIFSFPFLSGFSTTTQHPSDISLSLSSNFPSGPTLKVSYSTISASAGSPATAAVTPPPPLTLSLKSGIGLFGSPKDSPLIISANFSFSPNSHNPYPTFSLLFKPQLGSFSLRKSTFSNPDSGDKSNGEAANSFGFIPLERPVAFKDFSVDNNGINSFFKGISVMARTEMPIFKRVSMNFRWGVSFPDDLSKQMPYMSVNKMGMERVNEVKEMKEVKDKKSEGNSRDVEILKGMCFWMKREFDLLQKENRDMKNRLEEMKLGHVGKNSNGGLSENNGKKTIPHVDNSSGFEQWRNKKNSREENAKREAEKNGSQVNDVEIELQRAIKAASSS